MGRWWSRPWDGKDAHNCFLLSGPSALLWGLSLSGPLTSGSWLPFWFAWSLVLGLQVPHVLTLPCPLAPFPVLGGLSHLLPSYMASSVWTWGSSFMKYDLYMPASSSESFREPWPGPQGTPTCSLKSHPLASTIALGLPLACLAPMFTLTGDKAWLAPSWGHVSPEPLSNPLFLGSQG